jgi:hypothetical protein
MEKDGLDPTNFCTFKIVVSAGTLGEHAAISDLTNFVS